MSFLRNLFSRRSETANASATAVLPQPTPVAARPPAPEPKPAEPARFQSPQPPAEDCVSFPLKAITDLFTPELAPALHKQPSEHIQILIPRDLIRPQLATGAVRITFEQLRAATPAIFFNADGAPAEAKVLLPLEHVLKQMTPPSRRDDQRQPAIPVNIPSIFAKTGQPRANGAAARGSAEPWFSQRRPTYETVPEPQAEPEPKPKPGPSAPPVSKKPFQPLASITERPRREAEPGAVLQAAPTPPDTFALPLPDVLAVLPPEVRHALNSDEARTAAFLIPLAEIESRMRTGKLVFKWAQLRCWSSVELAALAAPDMDINLPLATVVPLFMAARETQDPRKQVEIDTRIPDIFSKSKTAAAAAPVVPATPVAPVQAPPPAAAPPPLPVTAAPAAPPPPPQPQPAPGAGAPAQVVAAIRALEGVTGTFIATADGLLVAGDVQDANENVLAAFAPTVFAQLTKYSDMAKLGLPESIDIHLGDGVLVHVRKAGKLYLGVLMPRGRPLPVAELTRISDALKPKAS